MSTERDNNLGSNELNSSLQNICGMIYSAAPTTCQDKDNFFEQLQNFWLTDHHLYKTFCKYPVEFKNIIEVLNLFLFIHPIPFNNINNNNPIHQISSLFPKIEELSKAPGSCQALSIWINVASEILFFIFIKYSLKVSKKDCVHTESILKLIECAFFSQTRSDPQYSLISAKFLADVIRKLSKIDADFVFKTMINQINYVFKKKEDINFLKIILTAFMYPAPALTVSENTTIELEKLYTQLFKTYIKEKKDPIFDLIISSFASVVLATCCNKNSENVLTTSAKEIATNSIIIDAILFQCIQRSGIFQSTLSKFITSKLKAGQPKTIKAAMIILNGGNFASDLKINESHCNFDWKSEKINDKDIQNLRAFAFLHTDKNVDQYELSRLLEQLFMNDKTVFSSSKDSPLGLIFQNKGFIKKNLLSVLIFVSRITLFSGVKNLEEKMFPILKKIFKSVNNELLNSAFSIIPLKYEEKDKERPEFMAEPCRIDFKLVNSIALPPKFKHDAENHKELKCCFSNFCSFTPEYYALLYCLKINSTDEIIHMIFAQIFHANPFVGSLALRVIQYHYISSDKYRNLIFELLQDRILSGYVKNQETVYLLMLTFSTLISIDKSRDLILHYEKEKINIINFLIIFGICSDRPETRSLALSCWRTITSPDIVFQRLEKIREIVGKTIGYSEIFLNVISSPCNNLCLFYISAFGTFYRGDSGLHKKVKEAYDKVKDIISVNHKIGLLTFIVSSAKSDYYNFNKEFIPLVDHDKTLEISPEALFSNIDNESFGSDFMNIQLTGKTAQEGYAFGIQFQDFHHESVTTPKLKLILAKISAIASMNINSDNVLNSLGKVFKEIYIRNCEFPRGPYIRRKMVYKDIKKLYGINHEFWIDILWKSQEKSSHSQAFSTFLSIAEVDNMERYFNVAYPLSIGRIVEHLPNKFDYIVNKSIEKDQKIIDAIINVFDFSEDEIEKFYQNIEGITEENTEKNTSEEEIFESKLRTRDKLFTKMIYNNCGNLLALAVSHNNPKIVFSVAIGTAILSNNQEIAKYIIKNRNKITLTKIIKMIGKSFVFCREQFLKAIFSYDCMCLNQSGFLRPWMANINIKSNDCFVFPKSKSQFLVFNRYSFIECLSKSYSIGESIFNNLFNDMESIEYIIMTLLSLNRPSFTKHIMHYEKEKTCSVLAKIASFSFWYHREIEIGFFKNKSIFSNSSIEFPLKIKSENFIKNTGTVFALYNILEYKKENIEITNEENLNSFVNNCLIFGLCCPKIDLALNGLRLIVINLQQNISNLINMSVVSCVINRIKTVTQIINEMKKEEYDQDLVEYISLCFLILSKVDFSNFDILNLSFIFLRCNQEIIVKCSMISFANQLGFDENRNFFRKMKNFNFLKTFSDVLISEETLLLFTQLIVKCASNDLLNNQWKEVSFLLLLFSPLIPDNDRFCFSVQSVFFSDFKTISDFSLLSNVPDEEKELSLAACISPQIPKENLVFCQKIIQKISSFDNLSKQCKILKSYSEKFSKDKMIIQETSQSSFPSFINELSIKTDQINELNDFDDFSKLNPLFFLLEKYNISQTNKRNLDCNKKVSVKLFNRWSQIIKESIDTKTSNE